MVSSKVNFYFYKKRQSKQYKTHVKGITEPWRERDPQSCESRGRASFPARVLPRNGPAGRCELRPVLAVAREEGGLRGLLHAGAGASSLARRAELGDTGGDSNGQLWHLPRGCRGTPLSRSSHTRADRPSRSPHTWAPQAGGGQVGVQSHTETLGFAHLINVTVVIICQIFREKLGLPFYALGVGVCCGEEISWLDCLEKNFFKKRCHQPESGELELTSTPGSTTRRKRDGRRCQHGLFRPRRPGPGQGSQQRGN